MTYTKTKKLTHKRQKICQSGSGNETGDANIDAISDGDPPTPEEMMLDHSEPTLMPSRRLRSQKKASTQIKLRSFLSVSTPYDWEKWYSRWDSKRKESRVKGYKPSADQPARPIKISSTQKIQNQSLTKKRFSNKGVGANKKPYDSSKFQSLLPCTFDLNRISQQGDCKTPKRASCPSENEVLPNWKLMYKNYWGSISPHFGDNALTGPCKCQNKCGADCWNRVIQVECDSNLCSNQAENCTNRVFARYDEALGLNKRYSLSYKIFKTTRRGYGLKTIRPFSSGELIVEYTGDIITTEEMAKILKSDYKDAKNYYFLQIDSTYVIDSGKRGSPARFINHSCSPNSQMEKWNVSGVPRIGLFASENIPAGTEITYDYNFSWFDEDSAQECTCGSKNCRGFINGRFRKSRSSSSNTNSKDKPAVNAAASVVGQKECINAQAAKNTDSTVVVTEIL
ncbi:SET domain-containing protein, partial [Nadsonia fulvescens var. elongata DSM 6958]